MYVWMIWIWGYFKFRARGGLLRLGFRCLGRWIMFDYENQV